MMKHPLGEFLRTALAEEGRRSRGAIACAVALGLAAVALLALSGWFIAAAAAAGLAGAAAASGFNYMLPSAAIRLLAIVRTGARYGERLLGHEAALLMLARVRPLLFAAVARQAPARALAITSGEATTTLVQDVQAVELQVAQRTAAWSAGAAAVAGLALTALAGWAPVLGTALCLGGLLLAAFALGAHAQSAAAVVRHATGALKEELALLAASRVELRCYALEDWSLAAASHASEALEKARRRHALASSAFDLAQTAATGMAAASALWLARDAGAPLAALAGLSAVMTIEGAAPLLRAIGHRGAAREARERLDGVLAARPAPAANDRHLAAPAIDLKALGAHLAPGSRQAIMGPSGCGKTTLVETLVGLREVRTGGTGIRIAGSDVALLDPTSLRAFFAWLPQDAVLIAGSVRENLQLAGDAIDETAMWRALDDAALTARVLTLPQGLDTWLGEDGSRLSGGERRRLALARAYLSKAPWLLLDEPTIGLDDTTEATVLDGLEARLADTGQGLILVTHRVSVAAICDRVLSFDRPPHGAAMGLAA